MEQAKYGSQGNAYSSITTCSIYLGIILLVICLPNKVYSMDKSPILKIIKVVLNADQSVSISSRYVLKKGTIGRFSSDYIDTPPVSPDKPVIQNFGAQLNGMPFPNSNIAIRILQPPKGARPFISSRDIIEIESDETLLNFHFTVTPKFINESKTIELNLGIPSTKVERDVTALVFSESKIPDLAPIIAPMLYLQHGGEVSQDVVDGHEQPVEYIRFPKLGKSIQNSLDAPDFKYSFCAIPLYFAKRTHVKEGAWIKYKILDLEHIREAIEISRGYEKQEQTSQENILSSYQLPASASLSQKLNVSGVIGGEKGRTIHKSFEEIWRSCSENLKPGDIYYCISDEITGEDFSEIYSKQSQKKQYHIYFRYTLPPKTESILRVEYEYLAPPEILQIKNNGLNIQLEISPCLNLRNRKAFTHVEIEAPSKYHIEETNYIEKRKESSNISERIAFAFESDFFAPNFKMKKPIKVHFAMNEIATLLWIRRLSFAFSLALFAIICSRVFFSYDILPISTIKFILLPLSGLFWTILIVLVNQLGISSFLVKLGFTGIWFPPFLAIITLILYRGNS